MLPCETSDILQVCSDLDLAGKAGAPGVPIPFLGKGNIWINDSLDDDTVQLARTIIARACAETAPGQLSILGYDAALTGVFAPFAELAEGEQRVLTIITSQDQLIRHLGYVADQIRETQDIIRGAAPSLLEYRRQTGSAIASYELVVLACDVVTLSDDLRATLQRLMRRGVAYGISFLIISPIVDDQPAFYVRNFGARTTQLLDAFDGAFRAQSLGGSDERIPYMPATPDEIQRMSAQLMRAAQTAAVPSIRFASLHEPELGGHLWERTSGDGITFCVGRYGIDPMEITLGDELNQRHNMLITGAVGQGKSNLIQVIIHSLCARYSPDELELYLLDFKEGVTFKVYAASDRGWLPHARALGLESDASFGKAVLNRLMEVYQERLAVLKQYGCTSINRLRRDNPQVRMPRILVVIDEFQMMFGEDGGGAREIGSMLEKSVRLFRAAGIHFILASQTISGNTALAQVETSLFAQVPVRIALKNSLTESIHTLGPDNPQAAFLRPHEAIVNLDYGAPAQNKRTVIAYADEAELEPLRHDWWQRSQSERPPYVFEGATRAHVGGARNVIARRMQKDAGQAPCAYLGELVSVDGQKLAVSLAHESGANICVFGAPDRDCDTASGLLQASALSLAAQLKGASARFLCCDARGRAASYSVAHPAFAHAMEALGHAIEDVPAGQLDDALTEALAAASPEQPVYAVLANMDSYTPKPSTDPFSLTSGDALKQALVNGPSQGLHVIGYWARYDALNSVVMNPREAFNTTVCLRADPRSVQQAAGYFLEWAPQDNRALAIDFVTLGGTQTFIPYAPVTEQDARDLLEGE